LTTTTKKRLLLNGRQTTGLKKVIATWAKDHGLRAAMNRQAGGDGSRTLAYFLGREIILPPCYFSKNIIP